MCVAVSTLADMADKYDAELDEILRSMWWAASDYYHSPDFKPRTEKKLMTYQDNMTKQNIAKLSTLLRRVEVEGREDELSEIKKLADYSFQYHSVTHVMYEVYQWTEKRLKELQALLPRSPQEGESK